MNDEEPAGIDSSADGLRGMLQSFWSLLEKRLELAALEFQEQRHRLVNQLVWLGVIAVLGLLALFSGTILIIALTWETAARLWVIIGLTLLYAGGAIRCLLVLKRITEQAPPPFAATIEEFRKDRAWFQKGS